MTFKWTLQTAVSLGTSGNTLVHSLRTGDCIRSLGDSQIPSLICLNSENLVALYYSCTCEIVLMNTNSTLFKRIQLSSESINISTRVKRLLFSPSSECLVVLTDSHLCVLSLYDSFPPQMVISYGDKVQIDTLCLTEEGTELVWVLRDESGISVMELRRD